MQGMRAAAFFSGSMAAHSNLGALHQDGLGVAQSYPEARRLFEENEYQEYLYVHGFGVECAEALAELWHKRMRAELGIGNDDSPRIRELFAQKYRGSRYSFGYPACPEMSDQETCRHSFVLTRITSPILSPLMALIRRHPTKKLPGLPQTPPPASI